MKMRVVPMSLHSPPRTLRGDVVRFIRWVDWKFVALWILITLVVTTQMNAMLTRQHLEFEAEFARGREAALTKRVTDLETRCMRTP